MPRGVRGTVATLQTGDVTAGRLRAGDPFGVYVHFPFCGVRCPYCDFAVDTRAEIPHDDYADAVAVEIATRAAWFDGAGPLVSIYFGGGTPGLWRPDALGRVLEAARETFGGPAASGLEITVEVNPGEVDRDRLAALRAQGVNRLSIGVQALDDRLLAALGRNHSAAAALACLPSARAAGFDDVSIDLMFGVPGQSMDDWRRAVDTVVALGPEHVSAYALTVERGTAFGSLDRAGRLPRPDDELVAQMFEAGRAALAAAGLAQYEVCRATRAMATAPGTTRSTGRSRRTWGWAPRRRRFRPLTTTGPPGASPTRARRRPTCEARARAVGARRCARSNAAAPRTSKTKRSGWGSGPSPGSTAPRTGCATAPIRWPGAGRPPSARSPPAGWPSTTNVCGSHAGRRALRRRSGGLVLVLIGRPAGAALRTWRCAPARGPGPARTRRPWGRRCRRRPTRPAS